MVSLLSLDLGVTTGWAVFESDIWYPSIHGTCSVEDFASQMDEIELIWGRAEKIVLEKPIIVRGNLGNILEGLLWIAHQVLREHENVVEVQPSEWKPHPIASSPVKKGITVHERDAIRIGRWYLATRVEE